MGKKAKAASPKKPELTLDAEVVQKVTDLKNEGNKLFAKKEFGRAVEVYEQACKLLPEAATERADLLCNKAACYLKLRKFKDATKECSSALTLAPNSSKALLRRAQALEQQGLFKQALSDVAALNRGEAASDDTREMEKRLKDVLAGRRPSLASAPVRSTAGPRPAPTPYFVVAKCTLQDETRLVHLAASASYADLLIAVRTKFPDSGPVILRVRDLEGDFITLTSRVDLQAALAQAVAAAAPKSVAGISLPTIRVQLTQVASEADVPAPPEAEMTEAIARRAAAANEERAASARAAAAAAAATPRGPDAGVDDWLVDFASLFRDMSGIDPDRHIDVHNEGWETCSRAMEAALRADEAAPLFEKAAERFKEVACTGLLNWGNVHLCLAHKHLDSAAEAGRALAEVAGLAAEEFDKAEGRYREALAYKPDFFDGLCAMGLLEFERAKVKAGLSVKPVRAPSADEPSSSAAKQDPKAVEKAAAAALREALERVTAPDVEAAEALVASARDWYGKAKAVGEKEDARRAEEAAANAAAATAGGSEGGSAAGAAAGKPSGSGEGGGADNFSQAGQASIMHGNILYEWSQLLAAVGKEWRPVLDEAAERFNSAGCGEADVRAALRNHTQADQLDLGAEPEAPATPSLPEVGKQVPPEAKGLPSLEPRKKKADK